MMAVRFKSSLHLNEPKDSEEISYGLPLLGANNDLKDSQILSCPVISRAQETGICWYLSTLELLTLSWWLPSIYNVPSFPFSRGVIIIASICFIPKLSYCTSHRTIGLLCFKSFLSLCSFILLSSVLGEIFRTRYIYVLIPHIVSCGVPVFEAIYSFCTDSYTDFPYNSIYAMGFDLFNGLLAILIGFLMNSPREPLDPSKGLAALFSVSRLIIGTMYAASLFEDNKCCDCSKRFKYVVFILIMMFDIISVWFLVIDLGGPFLVYSIVAKAFGWCLTCGMALLMLLHSGISDSAHGSRSN